MKTEPSHKDRDERTAIPLDPEEALRGLLKVDPKSEPATPAETDHNSKSETERTEQGS